MKVRLSSIVPESYANGPGRRAVVWFQGCSLGCPGCFNPNTHDGAGGYEVELTTLIMSIIKMKHIDGITFSGGEPCQQPGALSTLIRLLDDELPHLSKILFSGYREEELKRDQRNLWRVFEDYLDAAILGRYSTKQPQGHGLLGSSNQKIRLFGTRYAEKDFQSVPVGEVIIGKSGTVTMTGVVPMLPINKGSALGV